MHKNSLKEFLDGRKFMAIVWHDAASSDPWEDISTVDNKQRCVSVGILLKEDEHYITLTHTVADAQTCCSIGIPKGCIILISTTPATPLHRMRTSAVFFYRATLSFANLKLTPQ